MTESHASTDLDPGNSVRGGDTPPDMEAFLVEGYRRMSAGAKLARVRALNQAVLSLAAADVRRRHPDASPREIALRVAARWLDRDAMRRAFGWSPQEES